jgi:F0F1-type ATP synthase membrane subunit b/b'
MNASRRLRLRTASVLAAAAAALTTIASASVSLAQTPATVSGSQVAPGRQAPHGLPPAHRLAPPGETAPAATDRAEGRDHGEHANAEEAENGPPKPVNWADFGDKEQTPYIAALINFAILAFIYVYFGKAPIAAAQKQIEEAQKIKHEAEARSQQYASKLEDLGAELENTKAALVAAGVGEKMRIVREAEEKATRMQKDAAFLIEQEARQLRADIQRETVSAALVEAEELLRGKLTMADQERVAEEFLATLTPAKSGSATTGGAS